MCVAVETLYSCHQHKRRGIVADSASHVVGLHPTFSRHAKAETSFALVIWLNENVLFYNIYNRAIRLRSKRM